MVVVAGAAAVVRKVMVGGVLDVLVATLKQKPYTLQRPVQHSLCISAMSAAAAAAVVMLNNSNHVIYHTRQHQICYHSLHTVVRSIQC